MSTELPDQNPFASPMTDERPATPSAVESTEAERIRREYISHEVSIRSVGILFYLGVIVLVVMAIGLTAVPVTEGAGISKVGIATLFAMLAAAQWWVARGLRLLKGSVRMWAIALAAIGLLSFPIGTIINGYVIYLLASAKGVYVMTPEYQEIRALTPHIKHKHKTSWIVWVFLGLLVLVLLLVAVIVISGR